MQEIKLPNGDTLRFPDGMSDDQIRSAIEKEYPQYRKGPINQLSQSPGLQKTAEQMGGFRDFVGRAGDFVTGSGKYAPVLDPKTGKPMQELSLPFDVPMGAKPHDPNLSSMQAARLGAGMVAETDPAHRAELVQKAVPGAKVQLTKEQDIIITFPNGDQRILNQRGMSDRDFGDTLAALGKGLLSVLPGMGARSILGAAVRTGAGAGAVDLGQDKASQMLGSTRQPDVLKSATEGAVVGAFTALTGYGFKALKSLATSGNLTQNGQLTQQAKNVLRKAGVQVDDITPEMAGHLNVIARTAKNPKEAVRLARYKSLKIDATKGDVTGRPDIQAAEAKHIGVGTRGGIDSRGAQQIRAVKEGQPEQMRQAVTEVGGRVSGGRMSTSAGVNMRPTVEGVRTAQEAEKKAVGALWKAARDKDTAISRDALKPLIRDLKKSLTDFPSAKSKAVMEEIRKIERFSNMKGVTAVKLKPLDDVRKRLVELQRSVGPDGKADTASAAATSAKKALEKWADSLGDNVFVRGGKEGVAAYRSAREASAKYGAKFRDDKTIREMTAKERMPDGSVVGKMQPSEAVSRIMTETGSAKAGAVSTVNRLKQMFGEGSAEFRGVQQAVISKVFKGTPGTFQTAFRSWVEKNPELAQALFKKSDLVQMANLAKAGRDITARAPGVVNRSGSGFQAMRDKLPFPWARGAMAESLPILNRMGAGGEARSLASGINAVTPMSPGIFPGVSGYALSQDPRVKALLPLYGQ